MRKLASIRVAGQIFDIPKADKLDAIHVDGWVCVVKKGEFVPGDLGVYFEIDSFLPESDARFEFLRKTFITFNGKQGARIRTMRLRGQLAQGLFLPLSVFPELAGMTAGTDVTEVLGVEKWEPVVPTQLAGEIAGAFPSFISKSDQERVQNLVAELAENQGQEFEVTIKLDGTSMTVFRRQTENGLEHGVCGRNWNLRETEGNTLWRVARRNRLLETLDLIGRNLALQGELIGEGIQGNPEKIKGQEFYLYNIFDIDRGEFVSPVERAEIVAILAENGCNVKHVPIEEVLVLNHTVEQILALADGTSLNPEEQREGLVFKRRSGGFSFKAISNWYLEKHADRG